MGAAILNLVTYLTTLVHHLHNWRHDSRLNRFPHENMFSTYNTKIQPKIPRNIYLHPFARYLVKAPENYKKGVKMTIQTFREQPHE